MSRDGRLLCLLVVVCLTLVFCCIASADTYLYPNGDATGDQRWQGPWEFRDTGDYDYICARDLDGYRLGNHHYNANYSMTTPGDVFDLDDTSQTPGSSTYVCYTVLASGDSHWSASLFLNVKSNSWQTGQTVNIGYDGTWNTGSRNWAVYGWSTYKNSARIQVKGNSGAHPNNPDAWLYLDQAYLRIAD